VTLLLDQPEIDDTLRDAQAKTCKEVARNRETARIISGSCSFGHVSLQFFPLPTTLRIDSRAILNARFQSVLRGYIQSPVNAPAPQELLDLLSLPRIKSVDISQLDVSTGTTLLHEAARRKDLRLVELAVRTGADVFVRDRRGKGVAEGAGKDDRVKVFLRQFTNRDTTLLESPSNDVNASEPPSLKGYLTKYVNVAKGYGTRWFVLKDGMLSCKSFSNNLVLVRY
jgi:ankyrin repeat protein